MGIMLRDQDLTGEPLVIVPRPTATIPSEQNGWWWDVKEAIRRLIRQCLPH